MSRHQTSTPEKNLTRRMLMNRSLLLGGVSAVAAMAGCSAEESSATEEATDAATGTPEGGPGGGMGMGEPITYDEFVGVTTDGTVIEDLYTIQAAGVDTAAVVGTAQALLDGLSEDEQASTLFDVESDQWFDWSNVDNYDRAGVRLLDLDDTKKALAMAVLEAGLSAEGLQRSKNIMALNGWLGDEMGGGNENLTSESYYITVMGTPSDTDPWGWQFQGHHLVINYFVLGDQVVMTPTFMGSEPTSAEIDGETVSVFEDYTEAGLALMNALDDDQKTTATIADAKNDMADLVAGAAGDNTEVPYAGLLHGDMTAEQQELLWAIVEKFLSNMDEGHAGIRLEEIKAHADETYFGWIGTYGEDAVYYYRVQNPVVLIQCDCQGPLAIEGDGPSQNHIHTLIRTPNGNDYGMDLLQLHLELDH
jgi:hypothetical protein